MQESMTHSRHGSALSEVEYQLSSYLRREVNPLGVHFVQRTGATRGEEVWLTVLSAPAIIQLLGSASGLFRCASYTCIFVNEA